MGKVLHIKRKLQKHVLALERRPFQLAMQLAELLVELFKEQHAMVETNLNYVGALLNPYLLYNKKLAND